MYMWKQKQTEKFGIEFKKKKKFNRKSIKASKTFENYDRRTMEEYFEGRARRHYIKQIFDELCNLRTSNEGRQEM